MLLLPPGLFRGRRWAALLLLLMTATSSLGAMSMVSVLAPVAVQVISRLIANMDRFDNSEVSLPFVMDQNKQILRRINALSLQLMEGQVSMVASIQHYTEQVVHSSSVQNRFIERIEKLYGLIGVVDHREQDMNALLQSADPYEPLTLTKFAEAAVDPGNEKSVIELMRSIDRLVRGDNLISLAASKKNIFSQLDELKDLQIQV